MKITALLTGRGNNTLTDKNILPVFGHPLLYYTAKAALESKYITDFYASSDCDRILDAAAELGYKKITRPPELGRPDSQHVDVLKNALSQMAEQGHTPDILVVQLANVGTIKTEWIDQCIKLLLDDPTATAAVPAHRNSDHHPYRAKRLDENGNLKSFFDFKGQNLSTNRQDLPTSYFIDHSIWVLNVKSSILSDRPGDPPWTFMGERVKLVETEGCFDVHDRDDLERTEKWLIENNLVPVEKNSAAV